MIDLDALYQKQNEAAIDKADLFDFYHSNWRLLIEEIRCLRRALSKKLG